MERKFIKARVEALRVGGSLPPRDKYYLKYSQKLVDICESYVRAPRLTEDYLKLVARNIDIVAAVKKRRVDNAFKSTAIYFSHVIGFTEAVEQAKFPLKIVNILTGLYSVCDNVIADYDVFEAEAGECDAPSVQGSFFYVAFLMLFPSFPVGDAYTIVGGLPVRNGNLHIQHIASMTLVLRKEVGNIQDGWRPLM
ncbi:hypothetical protein RvY_02923 [Ramazzottius varieornatus]|uniref:Guanylate cyclase domain-containing protein n=1 Tax=Ramazzottius varieornatus TaxID=947166 RepID=A0A1D1UTE3_RAMVA|nr:hypothetical protein RvY_02923 [Ramazzottius varieornatus]